MVSRPRVVGLVVLHWVLPLTRVLTLPGQRRVLWTYPALLVLEGRLIGRLSNLLPMEAWLEEQPGRLEEGWMQAWLCQKGLPGAGQVLLGCLRFAPPFVAQRGLMSPASWLSALVVLCL